MTQSYNVFTTTQQGICSFWIDTDVDLINEYKTALLTGKGYVIWENGIFDILKVAGITKNPAPKKVT